MNLIAEDFGPPKQAEQPKPTLTSRLSKLIGKIADTSEAEKQRQFATYSELVNRLAQCEVDGSVKTPIADEVRIICESAGKSIDELTTAVSQAVEVLQLRSDTAGESQAIEALEEINQRIADHKKDFEKHIAAMQAEADQLNSEQRTLADQVRVFGEKRRRLQSMTTEPSPREAEITAEIKRLLKKERDTRAQAGQVPLIERFIGKSQADSPEVKELAKIREEIATLEPKAASNGHSVASFRLKKLYPRCESLEREVIANRRMYALGDEVAAIRKQQAELTAERNKLQAERLSEAQ